MLSMDTMTSNVHYDEKCIMTSQVRCIIESEGLSYLIVLFSVYLNVDLCHC